jgi:mannitol-1-/sugar-/sorbitol-6-/2-deoxyglucose-6-phosphatase
MNKPHSICPQAIIFDMDGTLVDTERLWQQVESAWLVTYGTAYDPIRHHPLIGLAMPEYVAGMKRVYGLSGDVVSLRHELEGRLLHVIQTQTVVKTGVNELLAWVQTQGLAFAVASNSPRNIIEATLGSQPNWHDLFQVVCSADDVPQGKPAPDIYLYAAAQLGVKPEHCIAIEDSYNGVRAAIRAKMTCMAVPDTTHTPIRVFAELPCYVQQDMVGVRDWLIARC